MDVRHLMLAMGVGIGLCLVSGAAPAGARDFGPSYDAAGTYTPPTVGPGDSFSAASYDGGLSCADGCTEVPGSAVFSLSLRGTRSFPVDPIRFRRADGEVSVAWSDSTSSLATVKARSRDRKAYVLEGTVGSGRFAGYRLSGWMSTPNDASQSSNFVGSLEFLPPSPI